MTQSLSEILKTHSGMYIKFYIAIKNLKWNKTLLQYVIKIRNFRVIYHQNIYMRTMYINFVFEEKEIIVIDNSKKKVKSLSKLKVIHRLFLNTKSMVVTWAIPFQILIISHNNTAIKNDIK